MKCKTKILLTGGLVFGIVLILSIPLRADSAENEDPRTTILISKSSEGVQGNRNSVSPSISSDGSIIAFSSDAFNLVEDDSNNMEDVFVHTRFTGQTTRVSIASDGRVGNGQSNHPSISPDGRYVAYQSVSDNLVENDNNDTGDVFVHDLFTGVTIRVSISSVGEEGNKGSGMPAISLDGTNIAFTSMASNLVEGDTNECNGSANGNCNDVFVHNRLTGETVRASVSSDGEQGNNSSPFYSLSISADGRYLAFDSIASNLVNGDTNTCGYYTESGTCSDIFVHDLMSGNTVRVSIASDGTQGDNESWHPSISADGRYVAFGSAANNLVKTDVSALSDWDVFVHDRDVDEDGIYDETGQISTDDQVCNGGKP